MLFKPVSGKPGDLFQRTLFLEKMGSAGNDLKALFRSDHAVGAAIEVDHEMIVSSHDQEHRGLYPRQGIGGQIRAPSAGDHGADLFAQTGCSRRNNRD
jgi:hypothetical protein